MAVIWANVVDIAPELSTVAAGSQTAYLAIAGRAVDPEVWGESTDDGVRYMAAHLATLGNGSGAGGAGAVTSETLGPMSRTYASTVAGVEGALATTRYGVMFLNLLDMLGIVGIVA